MKLQQISLRNNLRVETLSLLVYSDFVNSRFTSYNKHIKEVFKFSA